MLNSELIARLRRGVDVDWVKNSPADEFNSLANDLEINPVSDASEDDYLKQLEDKRKQ